MNPPPEKLSLMETSALTPGPTGLLAPQAASPRGHAPMREPAQASEHVRTRLTSDIFRQVVISLKSGLHYYPQSLSALMN